MNKWCVTYAQNDGEYTGRMTVTANSVELIDGRTFKADAAIVEMDEYIIDIVKVEPGAE